MGRDHKDHSVAENSGQSANVPVSRRAAVLCTLLGLSGVLLGGCSAHGAGSDTAGASKTPTLVEAGPDGRKPAGAVGADASSTASATFMMVGDVLMHQPVWESGRGAGGALNYDHLFSHIAADVRAADVAMLNQETILGGTAMGLKSYPVFNSPQELGDAEATAGFDVALAATNHAADMGFAGIQAELDFWRTRHPHVQCLGIQDSQEAYDAITMLTVQGIKIAVLNHTFGLNGFANPQPFAVRLLTEEKFDADCDRARREGAQMVIEVPHWGTEYRLDADDYQRRWAQRFLEKGVDVVIGSHPHVIEPVEVMARADGHKMLVFWSLGNFVSAQGTKERMVGGMAKVTFERRGRRVSVASWSLEPVVTHRATGTAYTTYKLVDYPQERAVQNGIVRMDGGFSRAWCDDFCAQVLGAGYDRAACALRGGAL